MLEPLHQESLLDHGSQAASTRAAEMADTISVVFLASFLHVLDGVVRRSRD